MKIILAIAIAFLCVYYMLEVQDEKLKECIIQHQDYIVEQCPNEDTEMSCMIDVSKRLCT